MANEEDAQPDNDETAGTQSDDGQPEQDSGRATTTDSQPAAEQTDSSQFGSLIDDDGKLFGLVNVVDALVVVLIVAVGIAGIALLVPGDGDDTRYVTVDLGSEAEYVAEQISEGDEWGNNFEITDVYYAPGDDDGSTNVLIRAEVQGTAVDPDQAETSTIDFDGEPLRYDQELEIETSQYAVTGSVIDVSESGETIETEEEAMVLDAEVSQSTANQIAEGDEYTLGGQTLLTVQSVTKYPTVDSDMRQLVLGVDGVDLRDDGGTLRVGDTPAVEGETIPVRTGDVNFDAEILQVGTFEEPGVETTLTVEYETDGLSAGQADRLAAGMTESIDGLQTAEILEVEGSGTDRTLLLELTVRELDDNGGDETYLFRGQELLIGDEPSFEFGGQIPSVDGEITDIST